MTLRVGTVTNLGQHHVDPQRITFFRRCLSVWYRKKGRVLPWRSSRCSPYELLVAEVLLQRTQAQRVATFFPQFIRVYPSWSTLANTSESDLRSVIEPLGLWRRRAVALLSLARAVIQHGGQLPTTREQLESLPAIGQYIANAVLTFCHGGREPLLDSNMSRVLERFFGPRKLADIRYDPYLQALSRLVLARGDAKKLNWAILDFAALVCTLWDPDCSSCPLKQKCSAFGKNRHSS